MTASTDALPRPRQARSIATRRRLLDAAIECLVECGYARTSTTLVCQRAGVSQGALFKHFPTKSLLLGATVEHLFEQLVEAYRRAFAEIREEDDRISGAVRLLEQTFRQPHLQVAYELYVASRTDPELRRALEPVVEQHRANLRREARALFPAAAQSNPDFTAFVDLALDAMQGRAIGALVSADPRAEVSSLVTLYRLARQELGGKG